jgi:Secretion system C-terminal sorting domain
MSKITISLGALLWVSACAFAQNEPFGVLLEPVEIADLGGLQSFAFGQHDGKWLIVGGRLDGLHRRQPFAAFDVVGNNNMLIVVDPIQQQKWSMSMSSLPVEISEQLSSTNMEFHQEGDYLYLIGGYGFNESTSSRMTFDKLTAIHVPLVIEAVMNQTSLDGLFRQITDSEFAVTGGHLKKINTTFYLLAGNKFDGNYNPMGNPTYTQTYTNAIRKFNLTDDGTTITIQHLPSLVDEEHLHRRDYNATSQILPNGDEGISIFSGVFQPSINLPYLNSVTVDGAGYSVVPDFEQYYNHYHCAVLPIYSETNNEMHSIFFGGIAQYYDSLGILVQDDNVPFVKTIARVTRYADNSMMEFKLPIEMPDYLGAGSEFIPLETISQFVNGVIKLDDFTSDTTHVGYIYGGINSTAPNIFFTNTGSQSSASSTIFKVSSITNQTSGTSNPNPGHDEVLKMRVYPNPNQGQFEITFRLDKPETVTLSIVDEAGKKVDQVQIKNLKKGDNTIPYNLKTSKPKGSYFVIIETPDQKAISKVIIAAE